MSCALLGRSERNTLDDDVRQLQQALELDQGVEARNSSADDDPGREELTNDAVSEANEASAKRGRGRTQLCARQRRQGPSGQSRQS